MASSEEALGPVGQRLSSPSAQIAFRTERGQAGVNFNRPTLPIVHQRWQGPTDTLCLEVGRSPTTLNYCGPP